MGRFVFLVAFYSIFIAFRVFAQEGSDLKKDNLIEQRIETLTENQSDSETDYSNLLDALFFLRQNPLDLNRVSHDDLAQVGLLDEFQIQALLNHRAKAGPLISVLELQGIDGFYPEVIHRILPFVAVSDRLDKPGLTWQELLANGKHSLIARTSFVLEPQTGYSFISDSSLAADPNSRYLGSRYGSFVRYRYLYGNQVSIALTGDKDAGERFFIGNGQQGFDFYSGHLALRNYRKIKVAVVGDYLAQFGQGLTCWMGQGYGKSFDPTLLKRSARGITPSNSLNEALFLRGGAATYKVKRLEITGFYSQKQVDAIVESGDTSDVVSSDQITSLLLSGLHRTPSEIQNRRAATEQISGGNVSFRGRYFSVGLTGIQSAYSSGFAFRTDIRNQFQSLPSNNFVAGFDYHSIWRNINFYGEVSRSLNGGLAAINGMLLSLDSRVALSIVHRNFSRSFQSAFTNTVSEGTRSANERGLLAGIQIRCNSRWTINAYGDMFTFPWLRYQTSAPSFGSDYLAQLNYTPSKKTELFIRYRQRNNLLDAGNTENISFPINRKLESVRFNVIFPAGAYIRLRSRADFVRFSSSEANATGFLFFQDLSFKPLDLPLAITLRYAVFDASDYKARIYAYESDVLYSFSVPGFYGQGSRSYILLNASLGKHIECWLRYAITAYSDRMIISPGSLAEIQGPNRSDVRMQLRYSF